MQNKSSEVRVKLGELEITEHQTDMDIELKQSMLGYSSILTINFYMPNSSTKQYLKEKQIIELSLNDQFVFHGEIESVVEIIRTPTIIYRISAIDSASKALKEKIITKEFIDGTPEAIAEDICKYAKVEVGEIYKTAKKLEKCNFHNWKAKDCLEWLFDNLNYYWFISKNKFYALADLSTKTAEIYISKNTGLLEVSFITEQNSSVTKKNSITDFKGFKVITKLNPEISAGSIINLESKKTKKGDFFVLTAKHKRIFKGHHVTELVVLPKETSYQSAKLLKYSYEFNLPEFIKNMIHEELEKYRNIKTGKISIYKPSDLLNDIQVGELSSFENVRPSIELTPNELPLKDVPIISPFAHTKAGLVFPYYSEMKSILLPIGGKKDDHLLLGSIWDKSMSKPREIQDGDFRLDLPIYSGGKFQQKNSQILIDKNGNISFNFKSLLMKIHENYLSLSRPSIVDNGKVMIDVNGALITMDSSQIELKKGTNTITMDDTEIALKKGTNTITMDDTEIELKTSGVTMTINASEVNIQ